MTRRYVGALAFLLLLSCSDDSEKPTAPAENRPPRINGVTVDPAVLTVGQQGRIRVDATDPDSDQMAASYVSQLGAVTPDANSLNAAYLPALPGRDFISVRVTDARGAEARFDVYVTVNASTAPGSDDAPPPRISFSPGPTNDTIVVGQGDNLRVNLCGESAASYRVSWGDGTADATTCSSSHAYAASGTYRLVAQGSGGSLAEVRAKGNFRVELFVSVIKPGGPAATTTTTTTTVTTTTVTTTTTTTTSTTTSTTTTSTTTTAFLLSLLSP